MLNFFFGTVANLLNTGLCPQFASKIFLEIIG